VTYFSCYISSALCLSCCRSPAVNPSQKAGVSCNTCSGDYRRVSDWMIGFIDTLYTPLGTTRNYSAIAVLHTLQFAVTHALAFTSRILATDFITVSLLPQITHEVFFSQPNSFLAISSQSSSTTISRTRPSFDN
jgi:hypothetical protein